MLAAKPAFAQTSVRPSLTGAEAALERNRPSVIDLPYNLKLGPVRFTLTAGVTAEFNDNINLTEHNALSDIILSPSLGITGQWQVTNENVLRLDMSFTFQNYLNHPAYNTQAVGIGPGSHFSYDFYVGGITRVTVSDSFQVLQDPIQQGALSNVVNFQRFDNTFDVTALFDLNKVIATFSYQHFLDTSLNNTYKSLNRSAESVLASAAYTVSPSLTVGADAGATYTYYEQQGSASSQNNSLAINYGPFVEVTLSRYLKLRLSAGMQNISFDSGGNNGDNSSSDGYFANATLAHRLNRVWTETLTVGHETTLGLQTNSETTDFIRYTVDAQIFNSVSSSAFLFYESLKESGPIGEKIDRVGGGFELGYKLTKKMQIGLGYQFTFKTSTVPDRGYGQNRFILTSSYQF